MALDATPLSPTANSYLTRAEANDYFTRRLNDSVWQAATDAVKDEALMYATAVLEDSMEWTGAVRTIPQALRWPRSGCLDLEGRNLPYDTVPQVVKEATAELALFLLTRDRTTEPKTVGLGVSEVKMGSMMVKLSRLEVLDFIPTSVLNKLRSVGSLSATAAAGGGVVKLRRS